MIEASGLRKSYGNLVAVADVSLRISGGQILGLLGPNGAGKTTTVSMIAGLVAPDSGEVRIKGRTLAGDADTLKRAIGVVPQDLALYEDLSARDNLGLFGALYGLQGAALDRACSDGLAFVALRERARDRVRTFSGGMKRRLNLAAALLHDPAILLMDEPTVGVDPQSRNAIFENIEALKARGKAILYTTHYMEEAERLCDRVVIIDHGRVIADDTPRGLTQRLPAVCRLVVELGQPDGSEWLAELRKLPGIASAEVAGESLTIGLESLEAGAPAALKFLEDRGVRFSGVSSGRADLETVFLSLTGRGLRDA